MADGESVATYTKGSVCLFLSKPMLNSSTLKAIFKKPGQWPLNTVKLIVLYVIQLKNPKLVLNNCVSLLRNLCFKAKCCDAYLLLWFAARNSGSFPREFWDLPQRILGFALMKHCLALSER